MWETSRMISFHLYQNNVNIKKNIRDKLTPQNIFKLSWEAEKKQSIEEMKTILETIHINNQIRLNKQSKARKQG